jgi:thiamine kinase-like enzyme
VGAEGELKEILQSLEASLGPLAAEPAPLQGGITNRNYRVTLGGQDYVVRRPGKDTALLGIDRRAERLATDAAAALGLAPPVVAEVGGCIVTRFVACTTLTSVDVAGAVLELGRGLRAFHDSRAELPVSFWVPDLLERYASVIRDRGASPGEAFEGARQISRRVAAALGPWAPRPCHNDLLPGNIIRARAGGRLMIVDWEYAGMGDPRFDLGNLAVNSQLDGAAEEGLLRAYLDREPSDRERAGVRLMRLLSDAREGAWGVVQSLVSSLDYDFEGYADEHFARLHEAAAGPDLEELLAAAAR